MNRGSIAAVRFSPAVPGASLNRVPAVVAKVLVRAVISGHASPSPGTTCGCGRWAQTASGQVCHLRF